MKKLFIFVALFATTLSLSAQRKMQVWEGNIYTEFTTTAIDSVTFLYSPIGTPKPPVVVHDTIIQEKIAHDTIYIHTCQAEGVLLGVFSVSADKQVRFSRGNLQYTQSTDTWSFAENQYDMIGTDNVTGGTIDYNDNFGYSKSGSALSDKIDLFCWSTTSAAKWGISISSDYPDYSGDFVDWGKNVIGTNAPNTFRTLTQDEWNYLLKSRPHYDQLKGIAHIKLSDDSTQYANGLILLPDGWRCPENINFISGSSNGIYRDSYDTFQTFTLAEWQKMETAGAVFLPTVGLRQGARVLEVQYYGHYWSATGYNSERAYCLPIYPFGEFPLSEGVRIYGQAVRLVQDL